MGERASERELVSTAKGRERVEGGERGGGEIS